MTKKTEQAAVEFQLNDRVEVSNDRTGNEPMEGVITVISKGWFKVELDESFENEEGDTIEEISARASSLTLLEMAEDDESNEGEEGTDAEQDDDEESDEDTNAHKMAKALREARTRYTKALRPDGTPTAHSNDLIARVLLESEPEEVCSFADSICEEPDGHHAERYAKLNNGQKRMNSGNKIRSHWRKAVELNDKTTIALIMGVLGLDDEEVEDEIQHEMASIEDRGPEDEMSQAEKDAM